MGCVHGHCEYARSVSIEEFPPVVTPQYGATALNGHLKAWLQGGKSGYVDLGLSCFCGSEREPAAVGRQARKSVCRWSLRQRLRAWFPVKPKGEDLILISRGVLDV